MPNMNRISNTFVTTIQLVGISLTLFLSAYALGMFPDHRKAIVNGRINLCESIAISSWEAISRDDIQAVERIFSALQKRNSSIRSIAIRDANGDFVAGSSVHDGNELDREITKAQTSRMRVPIRSHGSRWGIVEIDFEPIRSPGWEHWTESPMLILCLYFAVFGGAAYYVVLRRLLAHENVSVVAAQSAEHVLEPSSATEPIRSSNLAPGDVPASRTQPSFDHKAQPGIQHQFHLPHNVPKSPITCDTPVLGDSATKPIGLSQYELSGNLRTSSEEQLPIPYSAVSGLLAALAFRDLRTADHSRRVAELCASVAHGRMSPAEGFTLETAALLHDIGKIGVPDHILLKPAPLTDDEWRLMETHDQIGVEIIRASFGSEQLSRIIETHHAYFGGGSRDASLPTGYDIPLGARILTIADAYDAMVSDRIYRKGCSPQHAFAELRRCASSQFDPELVERFIEIVQERIDRGLPDFVSPEQEGARAVGRLLDAITASVDSREFQGLAALATQLTASCVRYNMRELALEASKLEAGIQSMNILAIVDSTNSLLDKCGRTNAFSPESIAAFSTSD